MEEPVGTYDFSAGTMLGRLVSSASKSYLLRPAATFTAA